MGLSVVFCFHSIIFFRMPPEVGRYFPLEGRLLRGCCPLVGRSVAIFALSLMVLD